MSRSTIETVEKVFRNRNGKNQTADERTTPTDSRLTEAVREGVEQAFEERDRSRQASDSPEPTEDDPADTSGRTGRLLVVVAALLAIAALVRRRGDDES